MAAEEYALRQGVEMIRIQVGGRVAESWAAGYASLLERFPRNLRIYADLDNALLSDVCLIDPHGPAPVVNFLFEKTKKEPLGSTSRPVIAMFVENAGSLAETLADQLTSRANELRQLDPPGG